MTPRGSPAGLPTSPGVSGESSGELRSSALTYPRGADHLDVVPVRSAALPCPRLCGHSCFEAARDRGGTAAEIKARDSANAGRKPARPIDADASDGPQSITAAGADALKDGKGERQMLPLAPSRNLYACAKTPASRCSLASLPRQREECAIDAGILPLNASHDHA